MNIRTLFLNQGGAVRLAAVAASLSLLGGCVSTQAQADGSTRVNLSVAEVFGMNKSAATAAAAPQAMPAAAVRTAASTVQSAPAGIRLSEKARAALVRMLSCNDFINLDDAEGEEMAKAGAMALETIVTLEQPVMVFGFPVSRVKLSADGSAATYNGYFTGVSKQQIIKAANLKLSKKNKAYYYRDAKAGELSFKHADPEMSLSCYIDTEGSYDDEPVPEKKKTKKK